MSDWLSQLKPHDVVDETTFIVYARQHLGCAHPTGKDLGAMKKAIKAFWAAYPSATWLTLVKTVDHAQARKRRFAHIQGVVAWHKYALEDGCLPELDPTVAAYHDIDVLIQKAMEAETDPDWRARLFGARGDGKQSVYNAWLELRGTQ